MVGWGDSGPTDESSSGFGEFHAGKNVVNKIDYNMLIYTMEKYKSQVLTPTINAIIMAAKASMSG